MLMNITTCEEDLDRYESRDDLEQFYHSFGLDGLEVMEAGSNLRGFFTPQNVIGAHLRSDFCWMDFWTGDQERLCAEFGSLENAKACFGGLDRSVLVAQFQKNLDFFAPYQPEYLVYHVSECTLAESMLHNFHYTSEQVVDAVADLVNQLKIPGNPWLLFENLWYVGLNMLEPEIIPRLFAQIHYPKIGIMLDTGHLLHTNPALQTDDEAVDYIHHILDQYPDLSMIHGIHLHQSLSGSVIRQLMQTWQPGNRNYSERFCDVFSHIFTIDTHQPFRSPRIVEILDRIQPEYLTWEQISATRADHARTLAQQRAVLDGKTIL